MVIKITSTKEEWRNTICRENNLAAVIYSPEWWRLMDVNVDGQTFQWDYNDIEQNLLKFAEGKQLPIVADVSKTYPGPGDVIPFIPQMKNVFVCRFTISSNFAENEIFDPKRESGTDE